MCFTLPSVSFPECWSFFITIKTCKPTFIFARFVPSTLHLPLRIILALKLGTSIYFFKGKASAGGKTITPECRYDDPTKGPMKWRSVTRIVDDNTLVYEAYGTDKRGKEEKMAEMTLTRKQ